LKGYWLVLGAEVTDQEAHAFASQWLMPRMGDFWRSFPEISVDHLISDDSREFRRAEVDLRVRYGFGGWPDETATPLMSETIYPIASPDFARRHAGCTAATIPELPLSTSTGRMPSGPAGTSSCAGPASPTAPCPAGGSAPSVSC
jgi:DNA-binding transcriptional LysR family regulator